MNGWASLIIGISMGLLISQLSIVNYYLTLNFENVFLISIPITIIGFILLTRERRLNNER